MVPPVIWILSVFWTEIFPKPRVTLCRESLSSSRNSNATSDKVKVLAVPSPVNWIPLFSAETRAAIAASSWSNGWISVPRFMPKLILAWAGVDAPVPPSETAKSVIPVIEPPLIKTPFTFWRAKLPRPRLDLASDALFWTNLSPSPTIKLFEFGLKEAISAKSSS